MLLNDNEYSLQTISEKTKITIENLEKLQNRDWEKLNKALSFGLISIIEREFNVDMSAIKDDANNFYNQQKEIDPQRPIDLVDEQKALYGNGKIISNIVTIAILGAVAYTSWYYFIDNKNSTIQEENTTQESGGMFSNTIKSVKNLLGSKDTNSSENTNIKDKTNKDNVEIEQNSTQLSESDSTNTETAETSKKFDITAGSSNVTASNNTTTSESDISRDSNSKEDNNNSAYSSDLAANSDDNQSTEVNSSTKSEVDKLLSELDENSTNSKQEDKSNSVESNNSNSDNNTADTESDTSMDSGLSESTAPVVSNLGIKVRSKRLWIGIYNLTTKKKINKIARGLFNLNIGNNKFAIVTGHSHFNLITENGIKKFSNKGKVYFTVSKDGIKELSRREYKTLTKRRAW